MKFVDDAPGISARIGRIIPRSVVHQAPSDELRSRIVRIVVVVEKITVGKTPDGDGKPVHRTVAGQLVLVAFHVFDFIAKTKIVCDVESRKVRLGGGGGHARQFAVGRVGQAVDVAESPAPGDLGIEDHLRVVVQAEIEEERRRERHVVLGVRLKAQRTLIGGIKTSVLLANRGGLIVEIPVFRLIGSRRAIVAGLCRGD